MPFIRDLVGGIAKANFDPENYRNKNFDPNQPIGGANVPYNKPSWLMRALDSQDAGELMDYNQKLARVAPENTINTAAKIKSDQQVADTKFPFVPPGLYSDPNQMFALGGAPTGTPAQLELNNANNKFGLSQLETTQSTAKLNNEMAFAKARDIDPLLFKQALIKATGEAGRELNAQEQEDLALKLKTTQTKTQQGIADVDLSRLRDLQAGRGSDITRSLYASVLGGTPEQTEDMPFINKAGPDGVQTKIPNPNYISPMVKAMYGLGGTGGVPASQGFNPSADASFGYNVVNKKTGQPLANFMDTANLRGDYAEPPAPPAAAPAEPKPIVSNVQNRKGFFPSIKDTLVSAPQAITTIDQAAGDEVARKFGNATRSLSSSLFGGQYEPELPRGRETITPLDVLNRKRQLRLPLSQKEINAATEYYDKNPTRRLVNTYYVNE